MEQDKFYQLLNNVLTLLVDNKLREDIDDTLLEKLLNVLKEGISNESFIDDLQRNVNILILLDKALSDLVKERIKLSPAITVFSLKLFGHLLQKENIFVELENSQVTRDLANLPKYEIFLTCSPSIHDALVSTLISIAAHCKGALWLIEQKFVEFVFSSSYNSTSYYVKKTSSKFFTSSIKLWSTSEFSASLEDYQKDILIKTIHRIMITLISGIHPFNDKEKENFCNFCVSTLKQIFISEAELPDIHLPLIDAICNYFKNRDINSKINQDVAELLCLAEKRYHTDITVIRKIIHVLVEKGKLTDAFYLASSFLSSGRYLNLLCWHRVSFFLMPFSVLRNILPPDENEEVFLLSSDTVYSALMEQMKIKSQGVSIMISCFEALSKLTPVIPKQAIESVILSLGEIFFQDSKRDKHYLSSLCLEDRRICLGFLKLFSNFLSEDGYKCLTSISKMMLFQYFISILKNPSIDCNIVSQTLRLLRFFIVLNDQHEFEYENAFKEEITALICRKLNGNKGRIVENALAVAGQMMNHRISWQKFVMKYSLDIIVWDIAIESNHDGSVKSIAIDIVAVAFTQSHYFDHIHLVKGVSKVDLMNILCNYFLDADFFIQRKAIASASRWLQVNYPNLPLSCKDNLYFIFSSAIRSLDLDLKLLALNEWQCFIENENFFPPLTETSVNSCLIEYCSSGFGSSLLYSLEDYDEAVKYKAATMMLKLREKLVNIGITKDFILEDEQITENIHIPSVTDSLATISVTKEDRDEGIDDVMKLSTAEQILNICKTVDLQPRSNLTFTVPDLELENLPCSVKSFLNFLWSDKLNVIVGPDEKSTSVFSEYSLSLLEDIISAEKTECNIYVNDTPDCY